MSNTHRYTGTGLSRANGPDLEPGDRCSPTDAELSAFGDVFEPLPDDDGSDDGDTDGSGSEAAEPDRSPSDGLPALNEAKAILADAGVDYSDYNELQRLAVDEYTDVAGNLARPQLQRELAAAIRAAD